MPPLYAITPFSLCASSIEFLQMIEFCGFAGAELTPKQNLGKAETTGQGGVEVNKVGKTSKAVV